MANFAHFYFPGVVLSCGNARIIARADVGRVLPVSLLERHIFWALNEDLAATFRTIVARLSLLRMLLNKDTLVS